MNRLEYLEYFKNEIEKSETIEKINRIVEKINDYDFSILKNVSVPEHWTTLKEKDLKEKIIDYKYRIIFLLNISIDNIENIDLIKTAQQLLMEGEACKNNPELITNFLYKFKNIYEKEIDFPTNIQSKLNTQSIACFGNFDDYYVNNDDLECVIILLKNYINKLLKPSHNAKKVERDKIVQQININNTNENSNKNEVKIELTIDNMINNVLKEVEEDDNLKDEELAEIKAIIAELNQIINEKPKKKWEKCKEIMKWLGDKTIKFGKWFIPILTQILTSKN